MFGKRSHPDQQLDVRLRVEAAVAVEQRAASARWTGTCTSTSTMFPIRQGTVTGHSNTTASGMVPQHPVPRRDVCIDVVHGGPGQVLDRCQADDERQHRRPRTPPPPHPRSEPRHAVPGEDRGAQEDEDVRPGRHAQAAVRQHPVVEQVVDPSVRSRAPAGTRAASAAACTTRRRSSGGQSPTTRSDGGDQPRKEMPLGRAESMRPAIQAIARGRAHEVLQRGAVAGNLARGPVAHPAAVAQVRQRIQREHDHRREQHQRARSDRFHRRAPEPERRQHAERRDEEDRVIDAAEDLRRDHRRHHQAVARRLPLDRAMPCEHRERNPERQLHLEVIEVLEAVRREREDHAGEQAGRHTSPTSR